MPRFCGACADRRLASSSCVSKGGEEHAQKEIGKPKFRLGKQTRAVDCGIGKPRPFL